MLSVPFFLALAALAAAQATFCNAGPLLSNPNLLTNNHDGNQAQLSDTVQKSFQDHNVVSTHHISIQTSNIPNRISGSIGARINGEDTLYLSGFDSFQRAQFDNDPTKAINFWFDYDDQETPIAIFPYSRSGDTEASSLVAESPFADVPPCVGLTGQNGPSLEESNGNTAILSLVPYSGPYDDMLRDYQDAPAYSQCMVFRYDPARFLLEPFWFNHGGFVAENTKLRFETINNAKVLALAAVNHTVTPQNSDFTLRIFVLN